MSPEDIVWLHVEISSKCNAWCPACPRSNNGYGLASHIIEEDLSLSVFERTIKSLPNIKVIQMCGSHGDPIAAHNMFEYINIAKQYCSKIQIHTNGSLRSTAWWQELALLLSDIEHDVWFGIDGLKGVHEIYRQGTDFDKVIENATAFIQAGGFATWQFIPYAHNEHQVKDSLKLSQRIGFKKFKLAKLHRKTTLARHYRTGEKFDLLPPKEFMPLLKKRELETAKIVNDGDCMHLNLPSIYLSSSGKISPCCYFIRQKTFDSVEELLYNNVNLENQVCLTNCGSEYEIKSK